jgi:hypothetical protein
MRNRFYLSLVSGRGPRHADPPVAGPSSLPHLPEGLSRPDDPFQQLVDELVERMDEADRIIAKLRRPL